MPPRRGRSRTRGSTPVEQQDPPPPPPKKARSESPVLVQVEGLTNKKKSKKPRFRANHFDSFDEFIIKVVVAVAIICYLGLGLYVFYPTLEQMQLQVRELIQYAEDTQEAE